MKKFLALFNKWEWTIAIVALFLSVYLWDSRVDININHYFMENYRDGWQDLFGYLSRTGQGGVQFMFCLVMACAYYVFSVPGGYKELWKLPALFFFAAIHFLFRIFAGENWTQKLVKNKYVGWLVWLPHMGNEHLKKAPEVCRVWVATTPIFLVVGLVVYVLKTIFGRPRPKMQWHDLYAAEWLETSARMHAYPSGHTATSFSMMMTLFAIYKGVPLRIIIVIWAMLAGMARVGIGSHWMGDVVAGAVVGYFGGKYFVEKYQLGKKNA